MSKGKKTTPSSGNKEKKNKMATVYQNSLASIDNIFGDASHPLVGLNTPTLTGESKSLLKSSSSRLGKTFSKLGSSIKW